MPPEATDTTQPAEPTTADNPTTNAVWVSPDTALTPEHGKLYKVGLIAAGVLIFFALAILLAFI